MEKELKEDSDKINEINEFLSKIPNKFPLYLKKYDIHVLLDFTPIDESGEIMIEYDSKNLKDYTEEDLKNDVKEFIEKALTNAIEDIKNADI